MRQLYSHAWTVCARLILFVSRPSIAANRPSGRTIRLEDFATGSPTHGTSVVPVQTASTGESLTMPRKTHPRRRSTRKSSAVRLREVLDRSTELLLRGAHTKALKILSAAIVQYPGNAAIVTRHADALYLGGRIAEARDAYRRACALDDTEFQAWYGCGCAEFSCEAYAPAIACFRRALALQPRDIDAHHYLAESLFYLGQVDPAIKHLLIVAENGDAGARRRALLQIAVIVPGSPLRGNAPIFKARREWAAVEESFERPRKSPSRQKHPPGKKLRIGYVSAFFNSRNWMKPVWGTLNHHDRSAFEIHLFLDGDPPASDSGYQRHPDDSIHVISDLRTRRRPSESPRRGSMFWWT